MMETGGVSKFDTRTAEEKAIDDWLPVTSSRNAKWWYSTFHNVTAMVGAGVLSLPYALSELGWSFGITCLVMSWVITLYTIWQMVEMHEMVPGKRFDRYHELGQYAFGETWPICRCSPTACGGSCFNSITGVSLAAAVMSLSYSVIAWIAALNRGVDDDVDYSLRSKTSVGQTFGMFSALGDVAFAYVGHSVALEIQATIPSTPDKPSKGPMWLGCVVAYISVAVCYFPVAIIGYYVFGNAIDDNILITLDHPRWLIAMANMFVIIHVIGGYQLFSMPVYDMIETFLVKSMKFRPSSILRFIVRKSFVATLHHMANNQETQKMEHKLVHELGLHCNWCYMRAAQPSRGSKAKL
ncbi:lysine histidine transporter like protein [Tanacetum coccineum]